MVRWIASLAVAMAVCACMDDNDSGPAKPGAGHYEGQDAPLTHQVDIQAKTAAWRVYAGGCLVRECEYDRWWTTETLLQMDDGRCKERPSADCDSTLSEWQANRWLYMTTENMSSTAWDWLVPAAGDVPARKISFHRL